MKIYLSNQDTSRMMTELCNQIVPIRNQFEHIVGIERGGVHISKWLAYTLGKEHHSILISRYGDKEHTDGSCVCRIENLPHTPFLLVDDIIDSGGTIQYFKELIYKFIPKFWIATLHWCPENSPKHRPDFFVAEKQKNDWIVYPWETE